MAITSVLQFEGDNSTFVWKHPSTNFNTMTQLIVHETQEAILFRNGQALDLFGPGRHTLETENIPLLRRLINFNTGGQTPFHCEVYFINKVNSMNILWGTNSRIPIKDAVYDIILPIGANGQFAIQIEDSRKFLLKLVGTIQEFTQETLISYFRGILMTRIKDYISNQMIREKITFLEIHSHLNSISAAITRELSTEFEVYGIKLVNFFVNTIIVPEDDPSFLRLKNALARKAEMNVLGFNYQQERTFDILQSAAENEGTGSGIIGAGLGLGLGVNIGNTVGNAMGEAIGNINTGTQAGPMNEIKCPNCRVTLKNGAKFCSECGGKIETIQKVTCPSCKAETVKGKFCSECGEALQTNCSNCKAALPSGAKFCLECGQKT